ncbi:MAG: hypothetical protein UIC63_00625 [Bacteroidaceae bacterium]|nr:hypothetical protein [Bacteroidaceae bacterium]
MKLLLLLITFALFVSCGLSTTKEECSTHNHRKYITVVDKKDGFSSAYTEYGHTMIYGKDSIDNYIVYFAKFDNNAGKYENRMIKEKIARVEFDSSLSTLKNFITISGGAFCDTNEVRGYNAFYFDEKLNGNSIEQIEEPEQSCEIDDEHKVMRILELLNVGYNIALSINNTNSGGWYNIVSALEPIQELLSYDVIENDTIYDPIVKKHISKISITTEGLTQYKNELQEKMISKN